jgi:formylglycine-generating enzyme required for sulfatase activity
MQHGSLKVFVLFIVVFFLNLQHIHANGDYESRIRAAELAGDHPQVAAICREWYQSGQYSAGVLNWCYNALMSMETNAVLLTQNSQDTYAIWLLQNALGVREDVSILNLDLLEDTHYRTKVIPQNPKLKHLPAGSNLQELLKSLLAERGKDGNNPLYFSMLLNKEQIKTDQKNLYLTGLALKYSTRVFDNLSILRHNYENLFRTDYLDLPLQPESAPETVAALNLNYLPAFLLLHKHYESNGELAKAEKIKNRSMQIARSGGREAEIRNLFFPPFNTIGNFSTLMSAKDLEKRMKRISEKYYAGETEVTNEQYEQFLQDLVKNKAFGLLDTCKTQKTDWRSLVPEAVRQLSDAVLFEHGHPDGPENPVQNIRHDAAMAYCAWLTKVYNQDTGKKKFKKVQFRLPTAKEWETLARAGRGESTPYPWGGYYFRNSKGCYLLNMNATEPCKDCPGKSNGSNDGGFLSVKVATYYPNDFGLYNMSGNVAEMVAESGVSKGGSWADASIELQIKSEKKYTQPAPWLGFRVVMDVLEEH